MTVEKMLLPRLAVSMTEGTVASWLASDGESVRAGQPLYLVETDKVESEIESPATGILHIHVNAGETCLVGTHLADIHTASA